MQKICAISTAVLLFLLLFACDGGSGSNNRQKDNEPPIDDPGPPIDDPGIEVFAVYPPSDDFEPSCELQVLPETESSPSEGENASAPENGTVEAGNTGYLVDAPVSGLAYETESIRGVTGPDGSFHYQDGETVRFTLGDTLIGELPGKALVSPFDLAGSPVITGMEEINAALESESDPFHAVINIAVLLQSLDDDADPANGIAITAPVVALFDGVQLDLRQDWRTFHLEYWLRYALGQANGRQLFSQGHWIINPAIAIDQLYRTLQVDARTFGQNREQSKDEGRVEAVINYRYDAGGNLTLREASSIEGRVSESESWTYDDRGKLISSESHQYADESIETSEFAPNGNPLRVVIDEDGGGQPEQLRDYEYDSDGKRTRQEWTGFEGEADSRSVWQYVYDQNGRLSRVQQLVLDVPGADLQPATTTYSYDDAGRLRRLESNGDLLGVTGEALGFPEHEYLFLATAYRVTYEYGPGGELFADVTEGSNPDLGEVSERREYNDRGDVIWERIRINQFNGSNTDEINAYEYEYDSRGNITRRITDHQANGSPDITETWQYEYDANGNATKVLANDREYPETQATLYFYDSRNNVVRREFYPYYDDDADPAEIETFEYQYYDNGGIAVVEQRTREQEHSHSMSAWLYDAIGRLVREEHDRNIDGVNDAVEEYEYDNCGILVFRQTHTQGEENGSTEHWLYDTTGDLRRHQWDNRTIGLPGVIDDQLSEFFGGFESTGFRKWQYDQQGRLVRYQIDCEGACIVDLYDLNVDDDRRVVNYEYDDLGNTTRELRDRDVDGWADTVHSYEYDIRGNVVRSAYDDNGDGTQDSVVTYNYDASDNPVRVEEDYDGDGRAERVSKRDYDAAGNLVREVVEWPDDGPDYSYILLYQYDDNGNPTRFEEDIDGDGKIDHLQTWEYNQVGDPVRETRDEDADGTLEQVVLYQYDDRGNLVRESRGEHEDGLPGWVATYEYDADDNLVRDTEGEDWDQDGEMNLLNTRTYESTGWGHIFNNP